MTNHHSAPLYLLAASLLVSLWPAHAAETQYKVRQSYVVKDLPQGARQIRGWFWLPEDRPEQRVTELKIVEGPETMRVTRDPRYGRSWLYVEAAANPGQPLRVVTEFSVLRKGVSGLATAQKAGAITAEHQKLFAAELRRDEKHMEVSPQLQKIADGLVKDTNPVLAARKFFDYVIEKSEHYSKWGATPKGKCLGDASECLLGTGDCCTDQHALFIALCRAKGIPCRLMFGSRLKPENEGKDHDPGYRCWPVFFAPGLGWVPLDISSADAAGDKAPDWFGGLDDRRLEWAEGRDFDLEPRSAVRPDLVIRGWVEVDGKVHKSFDRILNFQRESSSPAQVSAATPAK